MCLIHYLHTIRYLKAVQVFGHIRYLLYKPSVCLVPALSVRAKKGQWIKPVARVPSHLSFLRFRFLNEVHNLSSSSDWNNPKQGKLWLYHLHYFDDLIAEMAEVAVFVELVVAGGAPLIPFERIVNITKASFAAVESARTGQTIFLDNR